MDLYRFNKASQLAATKFAGMVYPYEKEQLHISHEYIVAHLLQAYGFDEDVVIAGILHDIVEDTDVTTEQLKEQFGERVANIVAGVTFDQTIPWKERSFIMAERLAKASPEAKAVKTADTVYHLQLCIEEFKGLSKGTYMKDNSVEESLAKYRRIVDALGTGWSHPLYDLAKEMLEECEGLKNSYIRTDS